MSSRIPLPYSKKVIELFKNPVNLGAMEDPTVVETAGSKACGDMIALYLKINEADIIEKITFESYGCVSNIAAASQLTMMAEGKSLEEAWKINWKQISETLGGLPKVKAHCGVLAVGGLKKAIRSYYKDRSNKPEWLPSNLSKEEKHAIEEEKMAEEMAKKYKL